MPAPSRPRPPTAASLLPWLTDLVAQDLHLGARLVARSHDCDAACAALLPVATHAKLPSPSLAAAPLPSAELAAGWRAATAAAAALPPAPSAPATVTARLCAYYAVDAAALAAAAPDLVLTSVAPARTPLDPPPDEVAAATRALLANPSATVLDLDLTTVSEAVAAAHAVARALRAPSAAKIAASAFRARMSAVRARAAQLLPPGPARPCVAVVQWADPLYLAGGWVPEAVAAAGCRDALCRPGGPSEPAGAGELRSRGVGVVVVAACALGLEGNAAVARELWDARGGELAALVAAGARVFVADATRLFARASLGAIADTAECMLEIAVGAPAPLFGRRPGDPARRWAEWTPHAGLAPARALPRAPSHAPAALAAAR